MFWNYVFINYFPLKTLFFILLRVEDKRSIFYTHTLYGIIPSFTRNPTEVMEPLAEYGPDSKFVEINGGL